MDGLMDTCRFPPGRRRCGGESGRAILAGFHEAIREALQREAVGRALCAGNLQKDCARSPKMADCAEFGCQAEAEQVQPAESDDWKAVLSALQQALPSENVQKKRGRGEQRMGLCRNNEHGAASWLSRHYGALLSFFESALCP